MDVLKNNIKIKKLAFFTVLFVVFVMFFAVYPVMAQIKNINNSPDDSGLNVNLNKGDLLDPDLYAGIEDAYKNNMKVRDPEIDIHDLSTMFFTLWQHKLLQEAKHLFVTRRPEDGELIEGYVVNHENIPRGIRELSLGGIAFSSKKSWIVWLNGERVSPDSIPKEVIDIKVTDDYIELKWFDAFTNLIYPIILRPHQRFNLDARIFLPGVPAK